MLQLRAGGGQCRLRLLHRRRRLLVIHGKRGIRLHHARLERADILRRRIPNVFQLRGVDLRDQLPRLYLRPLVHQQLLQAPLHKRAHDCIRPRNDAGELYFFAAWRGHHINDQRHAEKSSQKEKEA